MSTETRLTAILALVALTGACSPGPDATAPELTVVGLWGHGANLREAVHHQTHIHTGHFSFVRRGDGFAGEGQQSGFCRGDEGDYVGPLATGVPYRISGGVQDGDRVSFRSDLCEYQGTLSADGEHIEGTARCAYTDGGADFVWTGPWLANRKH
jgi:hypothetical protein